MAIAWNIIIICVFALIVCVCIRQGFTRILLSAVSLLVALLFAVLVTALLAKPIARAAQDATERFIVHQAQRYLPDENALDTIVSTSDKVVTIMQAVINKMNGGKTPDVPDTHTSLQKVAYIAALTVYGFLMFVVTFSLALAILKVLAERLEASERLPGLGRLDTVLGAAVGVVLGFCVVMLPIAVMVTVLPKVIGFRASSEVFQGAFMLRLLYALYPFK
ncbi:MAG: CvpA family protein [Eubacteriales bacterium]|jgi:energy-coupling factor transporter transmembrane protein EcfT